MEIPSETGFLEPKIQLLDTVHRSDRKKDGGDRINRDLKEMGINGDEWMEHAQDRHR